jgi:hypothetical protein
MCAEASSNDVGAGAEHRFEAENTCHAPLVGPVPLDLLTSPS